MKYAYDAVAWTNYVAGDKSVRIGQAQDRLVSWLARTDDTAQLLQGMGLLAWTRRL